MFNILDNPLDFTLKKIDTRRKLTLSKYRGKQILLSFIDVDTHLAWLEQLKELRDHKDLEFIADKFQIIVVLFSFWDNHNRETILKNISNRKKLSDTYRFPILLDNAWRSSVASIYYQGIATKDRPLYTRKTDRSLFNYIISSCFHITDKWNINSTRTNDPLSFNQLALKGCDTFDSADFKSTTSYIVERIFKLIDEPEILHVTPEPKLHINRLSCVTIYFSKPMQASDITYKKNYTIEGDGNQNLVIDSIEYNKNHAPLNSVVLNMKGSLNSTTGGTLRIIVNKSQVHDLSGNTLVGRNTISYITETEGPLVSALPANGSTTLSVSEIMLRFNKPVAIDHAEVTFQIEATKLTDVEYIIDKISPTEYKLTSNVETLFTKQHQQAVKVILDGIRDAAGNLLTNNILHYQYDISFPSIIFDAIQPDPTITHVMELKEITIPFDQEVRGAGSLDSYTCTLDGAIFRDFTVSYEKKRAILTMMQPISGSANLSIYLYKISNRSGNQLTGKNKIDLSIDTQTVAIEYEKMKPNPNLPTNEIRYVTIPFNKEVHGAADKKNYTITYNGEPVDSYRLAYKEQYASLLFEKPFAPKRTKAELQVALTNICDRSENPLCGKKLFTFQIDTIPPRVCSKQIEPDPSRSIKEISSITIPYTKEMLHGSRRNKFQVSIGNRPDTTFSLRYKKRKTVLSWKKPLRSQGTPLTIAITINELTDLAGNKLEGATSFSFAVDSRNPQILHKHIKPSIAMPVNALKRITIPYSKEVIDADDKDNFSILLDNQPYTGYTLSYTDQASVIELHKELAPPEKISTLEISLFKAIKDIPGNSLGGDHHIHYTIDTILPHISALTPQPDKKTGMVDNLRLSTLKTITVQYSKEVVGALVAKNYTLAGHGVGSLSIDRIVKGKKKNSCCIYVKGSPVHGYLHLQCHGIRDRAGNQLKQMVISYAVEKPRDIVLVCNIGKKRTSLIPLLDYYLSIVTHCAANGDRIGFKLQTPHEQLSLPLRKIHELPHTEHIFSKAKPDREDHFWKLFASAAKMFTGNETTSEKRDTIILCLVQPEKAALSTLLKHKIKSNTYLHPASVDRYRDRALTILNNTRLHITVHTLALGHSPYLHEQLYRISRKSKGSFLWNMNDNILFDAGIGLSHILSSMPETYNWQIASTVRHTFSGKSRTEQCTLDKSVKQIIVSLFWQGKQPLHFKIKNEQDLVISDTTIYQGTHYYTQIVNFPFTQERKKITPGGTWKIEITQQFTTQSSSIPYQLIVMVHDSKITHIIDDSLQTIQTGEDLACSIGIFEGKRPVETIYAIDAQIKRPATSLTKLLADKKSISARSSAGKFLKATITKERNPDHDILDRLFLALRSDEKIAEKLSKQIKTNLQLTPATPGKVKQSFKKAYHTAHLAQTMIPGIYTIAYMIKGLSTQYGSFERYVLSSVYLQQTPDPQRTGISGRYSTKTREFFITIKLFDSKRNLLGPGFSNQLSASIGKRNAGTIIDNYDGSYLLVIKVPNMQYLKEHRATIRINETLVYNDIAHNLRKN